MELLKMLIGRCGNSAEPQVALYQKDSMMKGYSKPLALHDSDEWMDRPDPPA